MPRILFTLLLVLSTTSAALSQTKKPLTVDDIVLAESVEGMQVSPDGRWVVWVKSTPDKVKNNRVEHLVLTSLVDKKEIVLTRGENDCSSPRWSPKGELIAFLSSRPAPKTKGVRADDEDDEPKAQVWLINPFGGEPWPLTDHSRDVGDFGWIDDDNILFYAQEKKAHYESELKTKKDDTIIVEDEANEPPVRLFKVDLENKKIIRLTHNTDRIQSLALSPDGKFAVTIHEKSLSYTFDHKVKPASFLYDVARNELKPIFTKKRFNLDSVHWMPDSKGFLAVNNFTNHTEFLQAYIQELHYFDLATGEATPIPLDWQRGLADSFPSLAVTDNGFVALLANGVRHKAARFTREGSTWKRSWLDGEHVSNLFAVAASRDGKTLVYHHSKGSGANQWYRADLAATAVHKATPLLKLKPDLSEKKLARVDVVRWQGALDEEVEGMLYYPLDHEPGKKYPLVVSIHGGPAWSDFDMWDERWAYPSNLYCARGAFVFRPNYHGSTHYGLKWVESIAGGKYYELPVVDIEKGIEHLAQRGLIDARRVALSGWSNGAILTMALITRNPSYRAAAAGAGGSEWVADWGTCEFGKCFSDYYLGKSPLDDPALYHKNAPYWDFPKVRTPTLLFHGKEDRVVPVHHGWMQYRALQQLGKTDVRFVLFPDAKHGLKKLSHQRRKIEEELAWFDRHLFQTTPKENLALKENSPLDHALTLQQASRHGPLFGVWHKDTLIPETVKHEDLFIGRFEVTRAQFAQFDRKYPVPTGTENHPAGNIGIDQAKAYCAWLSKLTGDRYRLGTVKEMEDLYEEGEGGDNTLNHWAGYDLTPEDRARLAPKIRSLPGSAPLLKQVGSFPPHSKDVPIFDLGGNVAEWVIDGTTAKTLGGSADRATDDQATRPGAEYVGFRVVRERK